MDAGENPPASDSKLSWSQAPPSSAGDSRERGFDHPGAPPWEIDPPNRSLPAEAIEEIDALLASFRVWLLEEERRAHTRRSAGPGRPSEEAVSPAPERRLEDRAKENPPDLYSLLAEMITLRKEVQIESRSGKASRERLGEALGILKEGFLDGWREIHAGIRGELGDGFDRLDQSLADFQSEQKRLQKEGDRASERAELEAVQALLDIRDALDRGRKAAWSALGRLGWRKLLLPGPLFQGILEGYEMGLRKLQGALEGQGVQQLECLGAPFNPVTMKAVEKECRPDVPAEMVLEEVRPGYSWKGRVIRCAEVKVAVPGNSAQGSPGKLPDGGSTPQEPGEST